MSRNQDAKQRLDQRIADLEQRVAGLCALRSAMDDDAIAEEMALVFMSTNGQNKAETTGLSRNCKTIVDFLHSRNNAWATVLEIAAGTQLSKNSVRQILYIGNPGVFDREGHRGGGKQSKFRLKENEKAQ